MTPRTSAAVTPATPYRGKGGCGPRQASDPCSLPSVTPVTPLRKSLGEERCRRGGRHCRDTRPAPLGVSVGYGGYRGYGPSSTSVEHLSEGVTPPRLGHPPLLSELCLRVCTLLGVAARSGGSGCAISALHAAHTADLVAAPQRSSGPVPSHFAPVLASRIYNFVFPQTRRPACRTNFENETAS